MRDGNRVIVMRLDQVALAPASLFRRAALTANGATIASGVNWNGGGARATSAVPGWPLAASTEIDEDDA